MQTQFTISGQSFNFALFDPVYDPSRGIAGTAISPSANRPFTNNVAPDTRPIPAAFGKYRHLVIRPVDRRISHSSIPSACSRRGDLAFSSVEVNRFWGRPVRQRKLLNRFTVEVVTEKGSRHNRVLVAGV